MTLNDFRKRIDKGGAALRIETYDSALVFRILDGKCDSYWVRSLHTDQAQECLTWDQVLDEVGDEWAEAGGWQPYRIAYEEVAR